MGGEVLLAHPVAGACGNCAYSSGNATCYSCWVSACGLVDLGCHPEGSTDLTYCAEMNCGVQGPYNSACAVQHGCPNCDCSGCQDCYANCSKQAAACQSY